MKKVAIASAIGGIAAGFFAGHKSGVSTERDKWLNNYSLYYRIDSRNYCNGDENTKKARFVKKLHYYGDGKKDLQDSSFLFINVPWFRTKDDDGEPIFDEQEQQMIFRHHDFCKGEKNGVLNHNDPEGKHAMKEYDQDCAQFTKKISIHGTCY